MKLDDLRSVLLSERETGRLTAIAPDLFEKAHGELSAITSRVYMFDDPFSDEARELIDETLAIRETLRELFSIRSRKILTLTVMHAEGDYYDREEVKRMIPAEKEMFEQVAAIIGECQGALLHTSPHSHPVRIPPPAAAEPAEDEGEGAGCDEEIPSPGAVVPQQTAATLSHPCALVHVLADMESFMGVDGRIYTLVKGDIVTLPERNAAVLSERNIVLNINLGK